MARSSVRRYRGKVEKVAITSRGQWLALRKGDVTASVVGALFGYHPYETALGLYAEKMPDGVEIPDADSGIKRKGRLLEGAVGMAFLEDHPGWRLDKPNVYLRDPRLRLGATPDFYFTDKKNRRGSLQAKTVNPAAFRRIWTDDMPPFWIVLQSTVEAMLCNASYSVIAALEVGDYRCDPHYYEIPRNALAERRIIQAVKDFWRDIFDGKPPKVDYARDGELLGVLYPKEEAGKTLDLRGDNALPALLEERELLKMRLRHDAGRVDEIETEIKAKLTDAEAALFQGWRATLKQQTRAEHVVKESTFRVLRLARTEAAKQQDAAE